MPISAPPATARIRRASPTACARCIRPLAAPPQDESVHTWHHPGGLLLRIVKEGTAAIVGGGYGSDMPGCADVLSDAELHAVLDDIRSTWPERERSYQGEISGAG